MHQACHMALRERGRKSLLGTIGAPAPQSCLVLKTCGASTAQGRVWGWEGRCVVPKTKEHKQLGPGERGRAAKAALPVSWSPKGGQATACTLALWWP